VNTPLRIGVDARELLGATTGVGRYLGELLRRWVARSDAARRQFVLYTPEPLSLGFPEGALTQRAGGRGRGTWWEQTWLGHAVLREPPDVFFAPAYTAPLALPCPLAVTIHDLSFVAHPEWFRLREGLRRRWLTTRAAERASVVFTDSDFSRREIEQHLGVPRARIQVIPPGVTPPQPVGAAPPAAPYVLFVGSLFNRRRLPDLIAAFARATHDMARTRLVIVGDDRSWPREDLPAMAASYGLARRVDFRSYVPEAELAGLYAGASVFAFLSEYEGFGLTPLEALSAGVPILVLDTPVAREIYGDAAVYVAADDIEGAAAELRRLLGTPQAGRALLERAPAVLGRYCWDRAADRTLEHLERIAAR
jgi:glycosyltransferase involved in cell wall biosynthesis